MEYPNTKVPEKARFSNIYIYSDRLPGYQIQSSLQDFCAMFDSFSQQ